MSIKVNVINKAENADDISTLERILQRFMKHGSKIVLSEEEQRQLDRAEQANDLLRQHYGNKAMVAKMLIEMYSVSKMEAYRIINDAAWLFGNYEKTTKEYERILQLDIIQKGIEMCFAQNDMNALSRLMKERRLLLQLDTNEDATVDWAEIAKSRTIKIEFNPALLGIEQPVDLDEQIKQMKIKIARQIKGIKDAELA